ncbi:MAG TPA: hypothetical protein PLC59_00975 [Bacteroidales bacterium]|jgi:hypothetical protein|nr:hypothetical protein [Bacteroidales bacterium]HQI44638.1 hypothetical protein [Bacteroidales bacterium]
MADLDFEVYEGKTFKELCKEIVERSVSKKDQLDTLIGDLRTLIKGPNDVGQFMPRIKELLEVGVKNDEQLIKLAAVVQRISSAQIIATGGDEIGLSEKEKENLMKLHLEAQESLKNIKKEVEEISVSNSVK